MIDRTTVVLYTRSGCHLCDDARDVLQDYLGGADVDIEERDIDSNENWGRTFFATIPVIEVAGRRLELAVSPAKIRRFLDQALGTPLGRS